MKIEKYLNKLLGEKELTAEGIYINKTEEGIYKNIY